MIKFAGYLTWSIVTTQGFEGKAWDLHILPRALKEGPGTSTLLPRALNIETWDLHITAQGFESKAWNLHITAQGLKLQTWDNNAMALH